MPNNTKYKPELMLTIVDVAEICRVCDKTVRRWIKAGDLPAAKLGGQWRISRRDLNAFVSDRMSR
ncbi:helix-turn-helix domain-containing protein [uncultured Roseovarius sp.]|uniref:helix-turn-helix domain-containing protein n=1 Tax=uncultured Roseovarius sp. TaxID=293344 RepID=UPI0025F71D85|nr:helix-turn-helix domain-containing protein [uncultured Roseovarius sp.]